MSTAHLFNNWATAASVCWHCLCLTRSSLWTK